MAFCTPPSGRQSGCISVKRVYTPEAKSLLTEIIYEPSIAQDT